MKGNFETAMISKEKELLDELGSMKFSFRKLRKIFELEAVVDYLKK